MELFNLTEEKYPTLKDLYRATTGTFKIASLEGVKYDDIVEVFGEPSITLESGDGKIQFEWVLAIGDDVFTIYDWKTFDRDYTLNKLEVWSVGGKGPNYEFCELLRRSFKTAVVL